MSKDDPVLLENVVCEGKKSVHNLKLTKGKFQKCEPLKIVTPEEKRKKESKE